MASLPEQIIELLNRVPGLTDREITDRLRGTHAPQQPVNQACRNLERGGRLHRQQRNDGKIGNYVIESAQPNEVGTQEESRSKESGRVVCSSIDFNSPEIVRAFVQAVKLLLQDDSRWHELTVHRACYFRTPRGNLPQEPGWYIICDSSGTPLYVGKAEDLDARLNTTNGSLDGFANSGRTQDPARNFIKAFVSSGVLDRLRVAVFTEKDLADQLQVAAPLSDLDQATSKKCSDCSVTEYFRRSQLRAGPANKTMEPTPFAAKPLRVPSPRRERAARRGSSLSR